MEIATSPMDTTNSDMEMDTSSKETDKQSQVKNDYFVCESKSGYIWDFFMYNGQVEDRRVEKVIL
jgi:hypothetical protein